MKVSLNTVKQYTDVDLSVEELVAKINQQLGGVEEVIDLSRRYEGAVIVKVVECVDHPNADRLHVCKVDDGGVVQDIERDENGLVQVVCGAPNVQADMFAVWLPPKSTVPASFTDKEPFVLSARELRGVISNGMMASPKELSFGENHDGLLDLTGEDVKAGDSFAKVYGLDDTIIDIENKMFTHRPDLFGQLGVAREIAGIQHKSFSSPEWYKASPEFNRGEGLELTVENNASDVVPRFMAVAIKGVEVKPSPLWLQAELVRLGSKPINNIVDATNYIMLLTAQPTHAYDYDKLRGHKLMARMAVEGESAKLLNGKTYELTDSDIVIADGEGVVGLAGIMGGGDSEVSAETKNIVLEVANFDMYAVRRSSMRHGLFTDALTRFNKGQSSRQNDYIMSLLIRSIFDISPGEQASQVFDVKSPSDVKTVNVTPRFVNDRLGLSLSADEMKRLLTNVEMQVDGELEITPPFWRTDLELPEDIVEEIGRLYGFDKLPRELPKRSTKAAPRNNKLVLQQNVRESLAKFGANEVLTYSFVHENVLKRAEQNPEEAFRLSNALSPDLQYYRLSLLPSLLDKVHPNIKAGYDEFTLFEIGKAHNKKAVDADGLPKEIDLLELVYASKNAGEGAAFYKAKNQVEILLADLGVDVVFEAITEQSPHAGMAPYDVKRSAYIKTTSGNILGVVGELKPSVLKGFKLPDYTAAVTVDIHGLSTTERTKVYKPLSRFPKVSQDISLKVPKSVAYADVYSIAEKAVHESSVATGGYVIEPQAIYQPADSDTKTITLHFEISSHERTLTDDDVSQVLDQVAGIASEKFQAERI